MAPLGFGLGAREGKLSRVNKSPKARKPGVGTPWLWAGGEGHAGPGPPRPVVETLTSGPEWVRESGNESFAAGQQFCSVNPRLPGPVHDRTPSAPRPRSRPRHPLRNLHPRDPEHRDRHLRPWWPWQPLACPRPRPPPFGLRHLPSHHPGRVYLQQRTSIPSALIPQHRRRGFLDPSKQGPGHP